MSEDLHLGFDLAQQMVAMRGAMRGMEALWDLVEPLLVSQVGVQYVMLIELKNHFIRANQLLYWFNANYTAAVQEARENADNEQLRSDLAASHMQFMEVAEKVRGGLKIVLSWFPAEPAVPVFAEV
jgi:hypothetical protein